MRLSCLVGAIATLAVASPAYAEEVWRWRAQIDEASARFGIPTSWIERVMRAESAGRPMRNGRPIRSSAGAMGLMQLMPATWGQMREWLRLGPDPDDPRDNILAGTAYLRLLYDRFGHPGLFAAYNTGPGRYGEYLRGRRSLPGETVTYLSNVAGSPGASALGQGKTIDTTPPPGLFIVSRERPDGPANGFEPRRGDSLFGLRRED